MIYENMGAFDWGVFSSIASTIGTTAGSIYSNYSQLQAAKNAESSATRRAQIEAEIRTLESKAQGLMNNSGTRGKNLLPIGIAAALGIVGIIALTR